MQKEKDLHSCNSFSYWCPLRSLSQEALADKANIDCSYIGGIERGEHNIAIINLLKIADALGIKASLFTR